MGLQPLEFSDCLTDNPHFRENLHAHYKELDRTSKTIKILAHEVKELLSAAKSLSKAQRNFSTTLSAFKFDFMGVNQTDDEVIIADSLKEFGRLIEVIEDERDRVLESAVEQIVVPLENFRKEKIGGAKDGKKKFDKQTAKFCQSLERHLNIKNKSSDTTLQEADATLQLERQNFYRDSMEYVLMLQEVQERQKFEFVEILLRFMYSWLTFYHQGHEVAEDFKPYMTELQLKLQKSRANFQTTHSQAEQLMKKMLDVRGSKSPSDQGCFARKCTKEGYLYLMEKKAIGSSWTKYYCSYQKENKILTMIPYNQVTTSKGINTETVVLTSCTRRAADSIDKRFCFDITVSDSSRSSPLTLQALDEDDRTSWLNAMDGKEPIYSNHLNMSEVVSLFDDVGFSFIRTCISAIEARGLQDEGLYRVVGVNSKVNKLTCMGLDRRKKDKLNLMNCDWEIKTVTSALKQYFRNLPEPLMTFNLHNEWIQAAKRESKTLRLSDIHHLVYRLPEPNHEMLEILVKHLRNVGNMSHKNKMNVANIGVCFGPTLMRPREETLKAIMDIKFCNTIIEILIDNYDLIFNNRPETVNISTARLSSPSKSSPPVSSSPVSGNKPEPMVLPIGTEITGATSASAQAAGSQMKKSPAISNGLTQIGQSDASKPRNHSTSSIVTSADSSTTLHGMAVPLSHQGATSTSLSSLGSSDSSSTTYAQYRAKMRPQTGIYSQFSPAWCSYSDHTSSTSSSTESLNSRNTNHSGGTVSADVAEKRSSLYGSVIANSRFSQSVSGALPSPGMDGRSSCAGSVGNIANSSTPAVPKRVRTLYACEAENDSELSFEPNQTITNVKASREPGWLEGMLNGKTGLIPANYVEYVD